MKLARFFTVIVLSNCLKSYCLASTTNDCGLSELNRIIQDNDYKTHRFLLDYTDDFGNGFKTHLLSLGEDGHWIEAGTGDAFAISGYFASPVNGKAHVTGVFVNPTLDYIRNLKKNIPSEKYTEMQGRYIENINTSEFLPADMITDYFGPFSYTTRIDNVLLKYIEILKQGKDSKIYIRTSSSIDITRIIKSDGTSVSILSWLSNIPGIKIEKNEIEGLNGEYGFTIHILDRDLAIASVPKLSDDTQIEIRNDPPPRRIFYEQVND